MNINRTMNIQEKDPAVTFRKFLAAVWLENSFDVMIAPVELPGQAGTFTQVIQDSGDLGGVDPFLPVMTGNAAPVVADYISNNPEARIAAVLRPCEYRTLIELRKKQAAAHHSHLEVDNTHNLVLIGMDCTGTFPLSEYQKRLEYETRDDIVHEALAYASHDTYVPRQIRIACQVCDWPSTPHADISIGTIGVAPEGTMLIIAHDEATDMRLGLRKITDGMATEQQEILREELIGRLAKKHASSREQWVAPSPGQHSEFTSFFGFVANCSLCADCLDACPLYEGELTGMLGVSEQHQAPPPLLSELVGVGRWLASCSGCGMCQEACAHGGTLGPIITSLSHRIRKDLHYTAGDPHQPLPWQVESHPLTTGAMS